MGDAEAPRVTSVERLVEKKKQQAVVEILWVSKKKDSLCRDSEPSFQQHTE